MPQLPTTTVVTPCDILHSMHAGPHSTARSSCVCASMKPGASALPVATISRSALPAPRSPTAAMRSPVDADVGGEARRAGAVEDGGVADDQVAAQVHRVFPMKPRSLSARPVDWARRCPRPDPSLDTLCRKGLDQQPASYRARSAGRPPHHRPERNLVERAGIFRRDQPVAHVARHQRRVARRPDRPCRRRRAVPGPGARRPE